LQFDGLSSTCSC